MEKVDIGERFNYWKKVYIMFGGEFSRSAWMKIRADGYNPDTHGHPSDKTVPYITSETRPDEEYYIFNQHFYDVLESDTK